MMGLDSIQERAREIWLADRVCVVCKHKVEGLDEEAVYLHLLEHRVRFLEKIIQLYCDCDCEKTRKFGEPHWTFCRRLIGDEALAAPLEKMALNGRK